MCDVFEPERLPSVPENDAGPFYCYVLYDRNNREYYVGHTGNPDARFGRHISGGVATTEGRYLIRLWESEPLPSRSDSQDLEADLKNFIYCGRESDFSDVTGLYLVRGAGLMEYGRCPDG